MTGTLIPTPAPILTRQTYHLTCTRPDPPDPPP